MTRFVQPHRALWHSDCCSGTRSVRSPATAQVPPRSSAGGARRLRAAGARCPCAVLSLTCGFLQHREIAQRPRPEIALVRIDHGGIGNGDKFRRPQQRRSIVLAEYGNYLGTVLPERPQRRCRSPAIRSAAVTSSRQLPRVLVSSIAMISRSAARLRRIATNRSVSSHLRNGARVSRSSVGTLMNRSVSPLQSRQARTCFPT